MQLKQIRTGTILSVISIFLFLILLLGVYSVFVGFVIYIVLATLILYSFSRIDLFSLKKTTYFHKIVLTLFIFTVISHAMQVFLPETSFDALWYHLPTIHEYFSRKLLVYDERWYQSLYPQYGDIFFVVGYSLFGVVGAKSIAFLFTLLLIQIAFLFVRRSLTLTQSLLTVLSVALFQVVSWQSATLYVDVISAVFLLWTFYLLLHNDSERDCCIQAALCHGVFLGTKFINIGYIPLLFLVTSILFWQQYDQKNFLIFFKKMAIFWLISFLVALPWYVRSWWYTGSLIYPIGTIYAVPVIQQMGVSGWKEWLVVRSQNVWKLPQEFLLYSDGYTTYFPIFILLVFSCFLAKKKKVTSEFVLGSIIGGYGLLFWYFMPPPSSRYILGLLIFWWITTANYFFQIVQNKWLIRGIQFLLLVFCTVHLSIRLFVNTRGLPYLLGWENEQEYLNRFRNGFLDEKINTWYGQEN